MSAGGPGQVALPPVSVRVSNIAHFLTRNARRLPGSPAIMQGDRVWTWAALDARVSALAHVLSVRLAPGDRVLVTSPNSPRMIEIMLACFRAGVVWVPANFRSSPAECAYMAQKVGARMLVCARGFDAHADASRAACANLAHVIVTEDGSEGADDPDGKAGPVGVSGSEAYEALLSAAPAAPFANAPVVRDTPCWLFFTSGSTGRPKAVVLTHGQLTFTIVNHLCDLMPGTTAADRSLVVAPLSHGAGMHALTQIAAGAASVLPLPGPLDPAEVWTLVERHRVSNMFTVPTIVKRLVDHPGLDRVDHSSLRHVVYAGAPMYRADQRVALERLGRVLVQYFGLGEVTGAITVLRPDDHHVDDDPRPGTCGIERSGMEVSIQREDGTPLPPGATGEICVTGPAVCAGYYRDDAANAEAFRDGWFRTGDLGHMDAAGYLFITGRRSDMYISGGSNVYPREAEEVLLTHPGLNEVAILGVPDPDWGEKGLAVCVAAPGHSPTQAELAALLDGRLARYKHPRHYVFLPEMPKTAYGKITKKLVRDHLAARGLLPGAP